MRLEQLKNTYLYENLDYSQTKSVQLWESAGYKLQEAQLTADQIDSIFTAVERGLTDAGSNRTMLGKGKDAMTAVNKAWEDLKTKVQDSGPIKNVDNAYDSAIAKIEKGLGGPDNAVSKIIMSYRKFAKEHPIAQGFIYSALIAAAGISGAGLGGAAVLGLLKMADKLLQGEKFSSAAYSGAKTGAMAYGASKLGDYIKGEPKGGAPAPDATPSAAVPNAGSVTAPTDIVSKGYRAVMRSAMDAGKNYTENGGLTDATSIQSAAEEFGNALLAQGMKADQANNMVQIFKTSARGAAARALGGTAQSTMGGALQAVTNSIHRTGKQLSEGQVYMICNRVMIQNEVMIAEGYLEEGPMDWIKDKASKAVGAAKTFGKNLTTTVTADKLKSAWQKAGSPTDSNDVYNIITGVGVAPDAIDAVYKDLGIENGSGGKEKPAADAAAGAETPGAGGAEAGEPADAKPLKFAEVKAMVEKLPTDRKIRLLKYLTKQGDAAPAKPAAKKPAATEPSRDAGDGRIEPTMA
jgi:hypothetical protein